MVNSRLAFTNEIRIGAQGIDGNMLKMLSGGDSFNGRVNYALSVKAVNKALIVLCANDLPKIVPPDDSFLNRLVVATPFYSFVDNPSKINERAKVPGFDEWVKAPTTIHALHKLIINTFNEWRDNGYKEPEIPDVMKHAKTEYVDNIDLAGVLEAQYVITNDHKDFAVSKELLEYLEKNCKDIVSSSIRSELRKLDLRSTKKHVPSLGKTDTVRTGIRKKTVKEMDEQREKLGDVHCENDF
jgi:hypothetical protein